MKYSCCDHGGGTLIWLKATPSFMLQRKRPCQTQAQNNGGQPLGNRAICMQLFAVSRTTKANQRNLNGGWQASTNAFALCPCQPSPLCLPSKNGPVFFFFFFFLGDQTFLHFFLPRSLSGLKVGHDCTHTQKTRASTFCASVWRSQSPNGNMSTPKKTPLSLRFISRVLKAAKCNSADRFRCTHLGHSATSNFKGVDRKQNMYYEVVRGLLPVNYRLSTGEEEKLPERDILRSRLGQCFALLSSIDGLAGRSGGRNLKSYFPCSHSLTRMHDKASCQQGQG